MHDLRLVFGFETMVQLRKKSWKIVTLLLCLTGIALSFVPRLFNISTTSQAQTHFSTMGMLVDLPDEKTNLIMQLLAGDQPQFYTDQATLQAAVSDGTLSHGVIIRSTTDFTLIVKDKRLSDDTAATIHALLQQLNTDLWLQDHGIDLADYAQLSATTITYTEQILGKDSMQGIFFAYLFMIILYMMILLYGNNVSTSVAREKDSRTMELLLVSTRPATLILGKVLSGAFCGICQITLVILCATTGYFINVSAYPEFIKIMFAQALRPDVILVFTLFAIMGYLLYLFLYAALGSLVSRVEDVGTSVAPVMTLFVIAYLMATLAISMPDATFVRISSQIPFIALFTMPIRYMLVLVPLPELMISALIMLITTWLIARLSIRIYREGALRYGNRLKIKDVLKRKARSH